MGVKCLGVMPDESGGDPDAMGNHGAEAQKVEVLVLISGNAERSMRGAQHKGLHRIPCPPLTRP